MLSGAVLTFLRRLGRIEKIFLAVAVLYLVVAAAFPGSSPALLLLFLLVATGVAMVLQAGRRGMRRVIWRLRNRLLVAYLFIAVIPVVLILALVSVGAWILSGQISTYLVTSALERRARDLMGPVEGLLSTSPNLIEDRLGWIGPYFRKQSPGLEILARAGRREWRFPRQATIAAPPRGWGQASGLVFKDGALYLWAHAVDRDHEVTAMAPIDEEVLAGLVPGLGEVIIPLRPLAPGDQAQALPRRAAITGKEYQRQQLPPPVNALDAPKTYLAPVPVAVWETPGETVKRPLFVRTRYSAVLRTVFGQSVEWGEGVTMAWAAGALFLVFAAAFLIVEIGSLIIGVQLTRSITQAVHNLYEGTQKVMQGDFGHRIQVHRDDQLGQLSLSFNAMTENLERLVQVAKEKERLQSELEIAREVQNQLFPKTVPKLRTIELKAFCQPARLVSGDYYDYMGLHDSRLAMAIGDVAGKGISAALLMATVQSTMRTQLRAGREMAAAAGDGWSQPILSTAALVARLNQQLYAYTPPEKFATFYFAIYDDASGLLTYTNAGHLPPVLIRDGSAARLEVNGMIVGAFPFARYEETSLRLKSGDLLVCFTDGVTEPENEYGEMFGEDRLIELLVKHAGKDTDEIIASVVESVRLWTGSPELQDDMTMLLARRL